MQDRILIADDETIILKILTQQFSSEGFIVETASNGDEAFEKIIKNKYSLALIDVRMPKRDGITLLKDIIKSSPETTVIIMTAYGGIQDAVNAIKLGAFDYITKPFDEEKLLTTIKELLKLRSKRILLRNDGKTDNVIIGISQDITKLINKIDKVKDIYANILITGESGTGKGVIARSIHKWSKRSHEPFVHINCAVLPPNLIESELFGHEKGAFTGATFQKKGVFELAGNGTIFLDEISSIPPELQAKLLLVLQEKTITRIGSTKPININARVISATNDNLPELIKNKQFREDLFYRLNIITFECTPLRYRRNDIQPLIEHFIKQFNQKYKMNVIEVPEKVLYVLNNYDWPGNIRELQNVIESSVALCDNNTFTLDLLPSRILDNIREETNISKKCNLSYFDEQEIIAIKQALLMNKGHREKSANELGISRRTLQYKLKKYNLI